MESIVLISTSYLFFFKPVEVFKEAAAYKAGVDTLERGENTWNCD